MCDFALHPIRICQNTALENCHINTSTSTPDYIFTDSGRTWCETTLNVKKCMEMTSFIDNVVDRKRLALAFGRFIYFIYLFTTAPRCKAKATLQRGLVVSQAHPTGLDRELTYSTSILYILPLINTQTLTTLIEAAMESQAGFALNIFPIVRTAIGTLKKRLRCYIVWVHPYDSWVMCSNPATILGKSESILSYMKFYHSACRAETLWI